MRIHDTAFYSILFFLAGVFAASFGLNFITVVFAAALAAVLFLSAYFFGNKNKKLVYFSVLSVFVVFGSFYYSAYNFYKISNARILLDKKIIFQGIVRESSSRSWQQDLIVDLKEPFAGKISVNSRQFPIFNYGDLVEFNGVISRADKSLFLRSGVLAVSRLPEAKLVSQNNGSSVKAFLLSFKNGIIGVFQKSLPVQQAAFLSGITLGQRSEFSKEFKNQMSQSGTTHLVALSGYNISILVFVVSLTLGYFFSRRLTFWLTVLVIIGFVVMVGAEASVVRAAVMGGILLLAAQVSRIYSFRNAIAVAAFLMVLANPATLVFNIGFQLSFLALIGIVYILPAIKKIFKISEEEGIMAWKENFLTTLSAQLAVAPLLVSYFGGFSLVSLVANILILNVIPLTMALGFILAGIGFASLPLALVFGRFVNLLLSYEIGVIRFFGSLNVLQIKSMNYYLIALYYLLLAGFVVYVNYPNLLNVKNENS